MKRRVLSWVLCRPFWQPIIESFCSLCYRAMNIGGGGDVRYSGEYWVLRRMKRGLDQTALPVFFDVGANVGEYAEFIWEFFRGRVQIYCFEPAGETFRRLQKRFSAKTNVSLNNIGLGEKNCSTTLWFCSEGSGTASLFQRQIFSEHEQVMDEKVQIVTLDYFCSEHKIEHIHLLKLDVEGAEIQVPNGAKEMIKKRGAIDCIQFEFGGCNIDSRTFLRDFFTFLTPQYRIYRILKHGLRHLPEYRETLEVFTTTNFLAVRQDFALFGS